MSASRPPSPTPAGNRTSPHWHLSDGTDIEILNWLDDHSRYLLGCAAHSRVSGDHVAATFTELINRYGPPASTLTDNGAVYTAGSPAGTTASNTCWRSWASPRRTAHQHTRKPRARSNVLNKTSNAGFAARPAPSSNYSASSTNSPTTTTSNAHTGPPTGPPPAHAYNALAKAVPASTLPGPYRLRYDKVDSADTSASAAQAACTTSVSAAHTPPHRYCC